MATLQAQLGHALPTPLTRAWGLVPARPQCDRSRALDRGDGLTGFVVAEARAPQRLELQGRHRFSRYALVFALDASGDAHCTLRAQSFAEFPGQAGRCYRALVISSGGHRVAVRRMLRSVAARA